MDNELQSFKLFMNFQNFMNNFQIVPELFITRKIL